MGLDTLLIQPLREMLISAGHFIPTLLMGLGILIIGWLIARSLRKLLLQFFKAINFNRVIGGLGLSRILRLGGIKYQPAELLSCIVYYVLMIMVLMVTIKAFGFSLSSGVISGLLNFVPKIITGVLVMIIGMFLAKLVSSLVYVTAKNTDMPIPKTLELLTKWSIVTYVAIIFFREIGLLSLFMGQHYTIFVVGLVFALALAFGLAGKDIASKYLSIFDVHKPVHK